MREIVLDTETTGLSPEEGHRVIEIGCVEMVGRLRTGKSFHAYLNPERDIPEEALRVHGITAKFLEDKPIFASVVEDFLEFIGEEPLVIHNAAFDMKFINAELGRLGFAPLPLARAVDTVTMARKKFPGAPASLDALCKRFNIDLSARTQHGALLDAELLADVYLELMGGRQAILLLDGKTEASENDSASSTMATVVTGFPERHFAPSPAELEAHETFLGLLKSPLWKESSSG